MWYDDGYDSYERMQRERERFARDGAAAARRKQTMIGAALSFAAGVATFCLYEILGAMV